MNLAKNPARCCCKRVASTLLLALTLTGCTSGDKPLEPEQLDVSRLNEVGEVLRVFQLAQKRPPKSLKELADPRFSNLPGFDMIQRGDVIVLWGATLPDTSEEPSGPASDEVLAYRREVPETGGTVLTLDRRMKTMTPQEFQASPKAASPAANTSARKG